MALPKLSNLSPAVQAVVVILAGVLVAGGAEYVFLQPVKDLNKTKATQVATLVKAVEPLRPFREKLRVLEADNKQLENQLSTLQRIVPSEKEVDNFIRLLQNEASIAGVIVRRYTSKTPVTSQYYVEVPFELELDGTYYDVQQFYDRLGRVERITNVTDLRIAGLGNSKKYTTSPNATIAAVCTVTTFFSREELAAPAAPAAPPRRGGR